jgi:hypothetical protein
VAERQAGSVASGGLGGRRVAGGPRAWPVFVVEDGVAGRKRGAEQTGTCRGDGNRTAESHDWSLLLPAFGRVTIRWLDE